MAEGSPEQSTLLVVAAQRTVRAGCMMEHAPFWHMARNTHAAPSQFSPPLLNAHSHLKNDNSVIHCNPF